MDNLHKIYRKGRERIMRGRLKSFDDLPSPHQKNFIEIKKTLVEIYGKEIEVSVFGSFYHGFWDELSDYDVLVNEKTNDNFIKIKELESTLNIKINVLLFNIKEKITIP